MCLHIMHDINHINGEAVGISEIAVGSHIHSYHSGMEPTSDHHKHLSCNLIVA